MYSLRGYVCKITANFRLEQVKIAVIEEAASWDPVSQGSGEKLLEWNVHLPTEYDRNEGDSL